MFVVFRGGYRSVRSGEWFVTFRSSSSDNPWTSLVNHPCLCLIAPTSQHIMLPQSTVATALIFNWVSRYFRSKLTITRCIAGTQTLTIYLFCELTVTRYLTCKLAVTVVFQITHEPIVNATFTSDIIEFWAHFWKLSFVSFFIKKNRKVFYQSM